MSPSDSKLRSTTLAVFVNAYAKKNHIQQFSNAKEKRDFRELSPLRPWENEATQKYAASRNSSLFHNKELSLNLESKRNNKKENEKFLPFSFKQNSTSKERQEKVAGKKRATSNSQFV